jgi:hypothetical protein
MDKVDYLEEANRQLMDELVIFFWI